MRKIRVWLAGLLLAAAITGCHHRGGSHVSGGVLGRVVIYRNGVAFYERNATVVEGKLTVRVPRERVDDFLKSLTIVDRRTKKPLAVAIPRTQDNDGQFLAMTLEVPDSPNAEVMLTYVTEAPAWKPSYRVVVGKNGKVMLESWAIVDNTSSEDWNGVLIGVGASSALAFRYDLWSVRQIDRDLLQGEERFAIAPPTGVSPYSDGNEVEELVALNGQDVKGTPGAVAGKTFAGAIGAAAGSQSDGQGVSFSGSASLEGNYVIDGVNTSGSSPTATSGVIRGVVIDSKSGEKLAGVTVVATGPALMGGQTAISDENGEYALTNLPQGTYLTTYYYADLTVERSGIEVYKNKTTRATQKLDPSRASGEVIRITGRVPTIDPTSTTTGVTINRLYSTQNIPVPGRTYESAGGRNTRRPAAGGVLGDDFGGFQHVETGSRETSDSTRSYKAPPPPKPEDRLKPIVAKVQKDKRDVVIQVHGAAGTEQAALARGQTVKNQLVDLGVPATKIHVVPKLGAGEGETIRVLAIAPGAKATAETAAKPASKITPGDNPVGESHFIAERPMTIRAGSSAMVAMVHGETTGGVVYLYDPVSERGDKRFAFKAVRLDNPTGDTLEPGPVTVYGDGKFIGEGITEPVPPRAAVVVPFALDKQIVVERTGAETDQIAKIVTVQRGVLTAEVQHRRDTKFTVTSRLAAATTVYLRHRLESGWSLVDHPPGFTRVGDSHLFEVVLQPGQTKHVTIAEATPIERTFDLHSDAALGMMKVFVNEPKASPALKRQIDALLATHKSTADLQDHIRTLRDQLVEFRSRSGELHAQLVTLKAVRTGGDLMATLKAKLAEMSDRTQKATIALVETQEKLMLARVKFQNQLAELKLTDVTKEVSAR
jgi:hypothetical protein